MNVFFKLILLISSVLSLGIVNTGTCQTKESPIDNINCYTQTGPVTHRQTKLQVGLFREALDKLGAASPEQVINIWINAEKTRNRVFHYAVAGDELKAEIVQEMGEPEDSCWIYGTSSPWLDKYEIVYSKRINDLEYEAKIRYYWRTSSGPSEPSETILSIVRVKDIWCVKQVKQPNRGFSAHN